VNIRISSHQQRQQLEPAATPTRITTAASHLKSRDKYNPLQPDIDIVYVFISGCLSTDSHMQTLRVINNINKHLSLTSTTCLQSTIEFD